MTGKLHIVCLLIASLFIYNLLAQENIRFDTIELPDNIYNSWINDIFQDHKGFIWFVNGQGLNRYDGYEIKTFDASSDNWGPVRFHYAAEDKYGFIWAGAFYVGIFRFNPALEKFEFFNQDTTDVNKHIWDVYADKVGLIWIISDVGLYSFKPPAPEQRLEDIDMLNYVHNPRDSTSLSTNAINTIFQDNQKRYWIGTRTKGIDILYERVPNGKFKHYPYSSNNNSVVGNNIQEIFQDSNENIWIGTQNNGISIVVKNMLSENINFTNYTYDEDNSYSLLSNRIFKIVQTKNGTIWISSAYGLQKVESKNLDFYHLKFDTYTTNENTPVLVHVNEMCPDEDGRLWISRFGSGIDVHDPAKYKFEHYKITDSRIGNGVIRSFFEMPGSNGRKVWISTDAGLYLFNRDNNKFIYSDNHRTKNELTNTIIRFYQSRYSNNVWVGCNHFDILPDTTKLIAVFSGFKKFDPYTGRTTVLNENAKTLLINTNNRTLEHYSVTSVYDIEEISEKYIVLATDFGIAIFDQEESIYVQKPNGPLSKLSNLDGEISDLLYDSKENLWISVKGNHHSKGVFRFNPRTGELKNFLNDDSNFKKNIVYKIIEDSNGDIWFSLKTGGLIKYNYDSDSIKTTELRILKNNSFDPYTILEDNNKNLWIAGDYLTKFSIEDETYWTYKKEDGLQDAAFTPWAAYKSPITGEMYFGGLNGFNVFHPDSIKASTYIRPVFITDFELMNNPANLEDFRETEDIVPGETVESIILNYDQNFFSFKFAALDYTNPSNNRYVYKLDGLDKEWIQSFDRKATYTNLDPGDYIFRVKGSNHDGVWNEKETLLKITILPPWWKTNLAYFTYAILLFGLFYSLWRYESNRQKLKYNLKLEHMEAENLKEINHIKSKFFTNISHEFRTPLTLILGPAEDISEKTTDQVIKKSASIIKRNAAKLYSLVNQLMDLLKLEEGKMKLEVSEQNIIPLLKGLFLSFTSLAERKRITYKFTTTEENLNVYIDEDKVEKVIDNLLSNAFKFTPKGGIIELKVSSNERYVNVNLSDSGIGIPKEKIPKIFDRFYQVNGTHKREYEGTGIGLALSKELIELHKGKIAVESVEGKGTTIMVSIPLGKKHLKSEEIRKSVRAKETVSDLVPESMLFEETENKKINTNVIIETEKPVLLLVEDNTDVRCYINENLENEYTILEATNGEDGLKKSTEQIPDLVISDIMMPKMDGFELCEKLKTDERTSHIPVILLTAKATSKDKITGYETGADDYIMKPFDVKVLRVRIRNLIEQRKKLREHFLQEGIFNLDNKNITSVDRKFLERAVKIINEHLSDLSFGVESFAKELSTSRTTLYKKLIAVIGESPGDFIKRIRLSKASNLLKINAGNISEIALEVGFDNPAYFSECFKKQFGITPSKYQITFTNH